ncbi:MAG: type II toxin-antitoxin system VapC family toxin [Deltaproteobacteria bacterium]|nr:type II toxin-antitoxin system VapC family toxin [Deltaproteobacteria bacterium]
MTFLIDTNIISEVRKGDRGNPAVAAWWSDVTEDDLWLSPLVLGEIRKGVELARRRNPRRAEGLEAWLADVMSGFGNRVLAVDTAVAEEWGRMNAVRPLPVVDALLAATAKANGLTLVTRNVSDMAGLDVDLLNPFDA